MVLLQVNSKRLGVLPFERDAPRPVYVDRIALRFSVQSMKVKAWLPQTVQRANRIESIEPHQRPTMQVTSHPGRLSGLEKLLEAAVLEASNHAAKCKVSPNTCKAWPITRVF